MQNKNLISVSDINSWLYCSRKVYLSKICGLRTPPNRNMIIGKIKHNILEHLSKQEEKLVSQIDASHESLDMVFMYEEFIKRISEKIFADNMPMIDRFMIDRDDILKKVLRDFSGDIKLRVASIKQAISNGFVKENIWANLDIIYVSELPIESERLGLKGRVDRILISKKDNTVMPFELKSREERIFPSDEVQLTAYAMMLEDYYKQKITKGFIDVGNNRQEIEISEDRRAQVLKIIEEIRSIYEDNPQIPPMQSNFNKCRNCEFREECAKL